MRRRSLTPRRSTRGGGSYLANFGGKVSGEWLLAKAAQIATEAPDVWRRCDKFIEAGDWLVWRLTGREVRSLDFAAYKAQYDSRVGYPDGIAPGLSEKLSDPKPVGSAAGQLSNEWRERTGIRGEAVVAVAIIDSHVVLPAVGAHGPGVLVGALGTSAAYLVLDDEDRRKLPAVEGRAYGAALPGLWCYEAGQPAFGDVLAWFVRTFPRSADMATNFADYNREASALAPGKTVSWRSTGGTAIVCPTRIKACEGCLRASTFRPAQSTSIARSWTASVLARV